MSDRTLRFTDVSLSDGQSARWAGAMTTPMALAVASRIADTEVAVIEIASPATLRQCLGRNEEPWQRIALLRERCRGVRLRAAISLFTEHGRRGADVVSASVATLWLRELAAHGVSEVLHSDPFGDVERLAPVLDTARTLGLVAIAALPYVPEQADKALGVRAQALALAGASRVMLRDDAGLLTADRLATLLPALRSGLGATPLDLHLRCQTALGPMLATEAVRLGIDGLDTAFAPLANGPSVPSLGTLLRSLRLLGIGAPASAQRLHAVAEVDRQLAEIANEQGFPSGAAWVFDLAPYAHQLPGDDAAWAMERLSALGLTHRLHAFSNECARVRSDLGQPPMQAPFARAIAEQALLHLQDLPRYSEIRPGVRRALQQIHAAAPAAVDASLARRVGALPPSPPSSAAALRKTWPGASDAALVIAQACGVSPGSQPTPAAPDSLRYQPATPAEALLAGLTARATRHAQLGVEGPGVSIQLQGSEG
ncbi:hypothetical protein QTH87_25370 [Variovorax sp. J22P168]|uniref:hypothetical protein n=1 Tax=Variovorax jilinensis TaxID=3053513 RepID=UPI002575E6EF|nr:hypothetical protein [Variovorax sp. J22P168]MDM0015794.1 hypothetical protein [Variovorax sp. J22P168]